MKNKFLVFTFLIIIFGVFIYVPIKEVLIRFNIVSFYKTDSWETVDSTNSLVYDKVMSLEAFIKNRYNNYFPFYTSINSAYYNLAINIDSLYLDDIYLKDNTDSEHIFYNTDNDFFYLINRYSSSELDDRLEEQVSFYNDINNKYPDVNLALYIPLRYESTSFKNINNNYDKINTFTNKLNSSIKYRLFDTNTLDEYLTYYYKTDHHYNSYGAYKAYLDILDMYGLENNFDINHKDVRTPYYGSMAKSTLLKKVQDTLTVIDIDNTLKVNITDKDFKPLYVEDKENPFFDYYVKYFNGAYDEIIYENDSDYGRNLLIIGDSMSWQIDYLLADNFDKTYVVNTKYGKWKDNDLILKDYIEENNITHILFLREARNLIFDADNFDVDKKVVR